MPGAYFTFLFSWPLKLLRKAWLAGAKHLEHFSGINVRAGEELYNWNNRLNNKGHKVLYVGKVVRNFHGRVIQHMGYHRSSQTQGLQLAHWAALIGVDVKINYCVFESEEANLMSILEYQLADTLKPLLGKHK